MSSILQIIVDHRRATVAEAKRTRPLTAVQSLPTYQRTPLSAYDFLNRADGPAVIAEYKRASPSQGKLSDAEPEFVVKEYVSHGAAMLSVLTEPEFFLGLESDLTTAREAAPGTPILMKDFIVDPYQIHLAKALGADCILLIMGMIPHAENEKMLAIATELGLSTLVETHSEQDIAAATRLKPKLLGINSRNLKTMQTSLGRLKTLRSLVPEGPLVVAESGMNSGEDLKELIEVGFQAFLIGTSLMKAGTPGATLSKLRSEARG